MPAASQNRSTGTGSKIESNFELKSSWIPKSVFAAIHQDCSIAVATAIEGVEDPKEQEVCVVDIASFPHRARQESAHAEGLG